MRLDRIKYFNGRPYIDYIRKSGRHKGEIVRHYGQIIICKVCNNRCFVRDSQIKDNQGKFCSHKCQLIEENNPNWKQGRRKHTEGYINILQHRHPFRDVHNRVFEHRLVVEKQIGRYLNPWEEVHHINRVRNDNRPKNLIAFVNKSAHRRFESKNNVSPEEIIFDGRRLN